MVEPLQRALHLRSLPVFSDLHANELATLAQLMREEWLRRGAVLAEPHRRVDSVRLLVEGSVTLENRGARRRLSSPAVLGIVELLAGVESDTRVSAETNSLALVIDSRALLEVIEEQFGVFLRLRSAMGRQVRALQRQLASQTPGHFSVPAPPGPPPSPSLEYVEQLIWLQRRPELRPFGVGVLAALIRECGEVRITAGARLWERDARPEFLLLVVQGRLRCEGDGADIWQVDAGHLLGLDAAFGGVPHSYAVEAETDVVAIRIDVPLLLDIAEDHFHVAAAILAYSARHLLMLQQRLGDATQTDIQAAARTDERRQIAS